MRHVRRDDQNLACADCDHTAISHGESQSTFENVGDLLVLMAVPGDDGALPQHEARQHRPFAIHKLTIDERVQVLDGDTVEAGVLQGFFVCQLVISGVLRFKLGDSASTIIGRMDTGLKGRVAIVAGSSSGIGKATAMAFAAEGAHLALCARRQKELDQVAADARSQFGVETFTQAFDVGDPAGVRSFVEAAHKQFGRVDVCVPNAGGPPAKPFLDTTLEDWERTWQLNLRSAIIFSQAVLPLMQQRHWGRIVTLTSYTVKQPVPELVLSNTIRAGIRGLVRSLAGQFGRDGITINNVGPGFTSTDRSRSLLETRAKNRNVPLEQVQSDLEREIPIGRMAKPEEVAATIVWLASESAASITGQTILVDGGSYKGW
jgi:3-oxoacyl-[acyl-carrier protein] reductase